MSTAILYTPRAYAARQSARLAAARDAYRAALIARDAAAARARWSQTSTARCAMIVADDAAHDAMKELRAADTAYRAAAEYAGWMDAAPAESNVYPASNTNITRGIDNR